MKPALTALTACLFGLYVLSIVAWFLEPSAGSVDAGSVNAAWVNAGWVAAARWAAPAIVGIHVLEFGFYVPWFRKKGRPLGPEVPMLLLLGVLHFAAIRDR